MASSFRSLTLAVALAFAAAPAFPLELHKLPRVTKIMSYSEKMFAPGQASGTNAIKYTELASTYYAMRANLPHLRHACEIEAINQSLRAIEPGALRCDYALPLVAGTPTSAYEFTYTDAAGAPAVMQVLGVPSITGYETQPRFAFISPYAPYAPSFEVARDDCLSDAEIESAFAPAHDFSCYYSSAAMAPTILLVATYRDETGAAAGLGVIDGYWYADPAADAFLEQLIELPANDAVWVALQHFGEGFEIDAQAHREIVALKTYLREIGLYVVDESTTLASLRGTDPLAAGTAPLGITLLDWYVRGTNADDDDDPVFAIECNPFDPNYDPNACAPGANPAGPGDRDTDGDGAPDSIDPNPGIPDPDRDGDGIIDQLDPDPDVPGDSGNPGNPGGPGDPEPLPGPPPNCYSDSSQEDGDFDDWCGWDKVAKRVSDLQHEGLLDLDRLLPAAGSGSLPCFSLPGASALGGGEYQLCFSDYAEQIDLLRSAILLIAAISAVLIILAL